MSDSAVSKTKSRSEKNRQYRSTPSGAASCAWNRLTSRAGSKYESFSKCYANVEVRMTREEFISWAIPEYTLWFQDHPGVTPSLDRINEEGHYEVGNLRLIPVQENRRRARHFVADVAPEGTKWCPQCNQFLPHDHFYPIKNLKLNKLGLSGWCKVCTQKKQKAGRDRRSESSEN